uniref:Allene oxidase synthase n=1 Tax=Hyoscyamus niger TaxID=4079 RepID=C6ENF2_HYONI|nr:allene oxidase synthase [Hyoscyamus niger]
MAAIASCCSLHQQKLVPITLCLPEKTATQVRQLATRKVPGDYGLPLIGPFKDRFDYFYNQGKNEFFKSRIQKYKSTVFRTNMPPGPFISSNPNVIVLLDGKSFPTLFDVSKVEKKDLFTGTFMPSTELTGGYRVLSYLDPSEPNHSRLKKLLFMLLSSRRDHIIPKFHETFTELFETLDTEMAEKGKADLNSGNDQASFNFLAKSLYGVNPVETKLGKEAPTLIGKWVLFNLHPVLTLGLPKVLDDLILHTFRLPPGLVKKDYQKLYDFFYENSGMILNEAEKLGISRDEACHNLLFATCFNSFGGMKIFFPNMMKSIAKAGSDLHTRLRNEIRTAVKSAGGKITMEKMPLMKSVVYEALRIDPPVASQYGRAKHDLTIESHDDVFEVKKGEMLYGYQPFATKDPKIFTRPEEFVPDRFVGEEGEKLLKHVLWSNGPETENPTVENKQCAGKDFVVLVSRLLVTEFFLRYDTFDVDVGTSPLGAKITITSLKKA